MKVLFAIIISVALLALENFLSKRKNFIFGLILPILIIIGFVLFMVFKAQPHELGRWLFRFGLLFLITISVYFEGREALKAKRKKELEKMTIQDL